MNTNAGLVIWGLKWTGGVALCLAWLVPNHMPPWTAFYNELAAVVAVLVWACLVALPSRKALVPLPAMFVLGMSAIPVIQFLFGLIDYGGDAVMATSYLALCGLSVVVGANLKILDGRFPIFLAWVCLTGAMVSVILAMHQWLGLGQLGIGLMDMPPYGRPYANLGQPNNLATLLCLGLAAALYLRERGQFGRAVLALLAVLLLAGIAMTRSRTAILAILVMAGWIFWGRRRFGLKCSAAETVSGVVVFAVLWAGWPAVSDWLHLSAESTVGRLQGTFTGEIRLVLWQQLLDAVWRQPMTGYGWNQVSAAQVAVIAEYPNVAPAEYSHNLVIDLLVWNGVPLGAMIVLVMAGWLVMQMRSIKSAESWFALLFILLIGTHGMVELPHAYAYFLLPAGLCIGILCRQQAIAFSLPRPAYAGLVAASIVVSGWIFVEYQTIEADYRLMRFESIGLERRSADAVAPKVVLLTQLQDFIRFARTEATEGMTNEEIHWMERVAHRYPYPPALMRYALALGMNHRPEEAALELRRLKQIQPAERFGEVRDAWPSLVKRYPQLGNVSLPAGGT